MNPVRTAAACVAALVVSVLLSWGASAEDMRFEFKNGTKSVVRGGLANGNVWYWLDPGATGNVYSAFTKGVATSITGFGANSAQHSAQIERMGANGGTEKKLCEWTVRIRWLSISETWECLLDTPLVNESNCQGTRTSGPGAPCVFTFVAS